MRLASLTMRMIWASIVSLPTRSARRTKVPVPLTVPPISFLAGAFLDRDRLAGDHRLVDGTRAVDHHAVDGNLLARTDPQPIARNDQIERNILFPSIMLRSGEPSWVQAQATREWRCRSGGVLAARAPGPATQA